MNAAADQVMDLIFGRWRSQILSAGTELGVFDHLDKQRAKTAGHAGGRVRRRSGPALSLAQGAGGHRPA